MGASEVANESPTSLAGPRQLHIAKRGLLARLTGGVAGGGVARFYVDNPDSRVQGRFSIVSNSMDDLVGAELSLWLAACEWDQSGPSGLLIPHTDLYGSEGAPLPFPTGAGLRGYSREFVTAADAIYGELTLADSEGEGAVADIYVTARIQPSGQRLPWPEWEEVRSQLAVHILRKVVR